SGILHSNEFPVYVMKGTYAARRDINRISSTVLAVEECVIDGAFNQVFHSLVQQLNMEDRVVITSALAARIQEQTRQADEYKKSIARIDTEIHKEEMAQAVSKELGDEQGYRTATVQLVQLRKDRVELQAKLDHVGNESDELREVIDLTRILSDSITNLKR